ncbi:hypothetical protein PENNAL_c0594G08307, partial [Penicillium nalgiovense]
FENIGVTSLSNRQNHQSLALIATESVRDATASLAPTDLRTKRDSSTRD